MKIFAILSVLSSITMAIGLYLSMRQYFRIKAYKEGRKSKNILIEHTIKGPQYAFGNDFIEYFPLTFMLHKLDKAMYENMNDELKKLYTTKYKHEFIFWISFITFIILPGGKFTW